jgi:hypothetical protein
MRNANTGIKGWLNRNILGPNNQFKINEDSVSENLSGDVVIKDYLDEGDPNNWMEQYETWEEVPTWKKNVPFVRDVWENKQEIKEKTESADGLTADERDQGFLPKSGPAPMKGVTQINTTPMVVDTSGNEFKKKEEEESTTINEAEIRERAELFNKMLSEGFEKEKKSAQISDASDYALKFFEETTKGKGMKEAAGAVAGFAVSKPSKTEGVKAEQKKTKQTATVMAINDYLAGKKSQRELDKILKLADYKGNINLKNQIELIELKRKDIGTRISEAAAKSGIGGVATISTIENVLRPEGKKITKIPKEDTGKWQPDKEDEGSYVIEEETKSVFEIINGVPVKIY